MVGQTISHYEVIEELGHGGMGAVYKARDTLLDRVLAIKVLRPDVASPTRERRFIQEAKTASSLNHPNIVTIYEIFHVADSPCIAMEYVSGETLEQRLEKGRLSLRTGLDWGTALADALARAHEAGIVHRDVKPSNIMINDQGLVKILDFGLAKLLELSDESEHGERLTQEGKFVGTPPYLSPEQALGDKVDARSDIFSLGTVLFEMFTGQRAFERYTNVEMVTAVVREQPKKIRGIVPELPAYLEKIIGQCLEKKPERRIQRMQDVKEALENVRQTDSLSRLLAAQPPPPFWKTWKAWAAAALLATILTGAGVFWWGRTRYGGSRSASVMTRVTSDEGLTTDPAISPDGKFLAYASDRGGESLDIWIQPLSGGEAVKLTNHVADDHEPVFSPDGSKVAFRSEREGGGIYITSILGGAERLLVHKGRRPRFSPDGKWLLYWVGFATGDPTSPGSNKIFIVPAEGGTPKELVPEFESALYPVWSPDGKNVLFLGVSKADKPAPNATPGVIRPVDRLDWWVTNIDQGTVVKTGVHNELAKQGLSVWASSGAGIAPDLWLPSDNQVAFSASLGTADTFRDSVNLWSIALSPKSWKAIPPARQLTSGTTYESRPAASASGEILFSNSEVRTGIWMLPLNSNEAKVTGDLKPLTKGTAFHAQPSVSLNGNKIVYYATKSGNMDLWVLDVPSGKESPLTSTPVGESNPQISADGTKVYYTIYGKREAYWMATSGGERTKICDDCGTWGLSNDQTKILYWFSNAKPLVSIGLVRLPGGEKSEVLSHPEYGLYQPHFSPDDKWITFLAKMGQDRSRIYATRFYGAVNHYVSGWIPITDGENLDDKPRWSPDGNLMYFTSERDGFRCIWAQRLDPATKHPTGAPFAVHHFHASRRSLMNVGLGPLEISVSRNALIFNLGEITGNIWRVAR